MLTLRHCNRRGTLKFHDVRPSVRDKKFCYDRPCYFALFCHETSKKRNTTYRIDQSGLGKFFVSDTRTVTSRLAPTSRTCHIKAEKATQAKLASYVVLLALCRKLKANTAWLVSAARYTRPSIAFYACPAKYDETGFFRTSIERFSKV